MVRRSRPLKAFGFLAASAILGGLLGPVALAGTTIKRYAADIAPSPPSVPAGSTAAFTLTITNLADPQQLGSANLTAPPGFTLVSASTPSPAGSASIVGDTVRLRDLSLPPGETMSVGFDATAPCFPGSYTWGLQVKQANNFNGPPGNDFVPDPDQVSLTTDVTGTCQLAFRLEDPAGSGSFTTGQPSHAEKDATITTVAFTPGGAPVIVEAEDGSGHRLTSFTGSIELSISSADPPGGTLSGGTPASQADGAATFAPSIDAIGTYTLLASSDAIPSTGWATSDPFQIVDDACGPGETCQVTIPTMMEVETTNTSSSGFTFLSVGVEDIDCGDTYGHAPFTTLIDSTEASTSGTKTETVTIFKQFVNAQPNNGAAHYQVCFSRPASAGTFTTLDGTDAPLVDGEYLGLLPPCPPQMPEPPCIRSKNKDRAGNVVIVLLLDENDPKHR